MSTSGAVIKCGTIKNATNTCQQVFLFEMKISGDRKKVLGDKTRSASVERVRLKLFSLLADVLITFYGPRISCKSALIRIYHVTPSIGEMKSKRGSGDSRLKFSSYERSVIK
jgi:hypothetical protein